MRSIILSAILALAATTTARAQDTEARPSRAPGAQLLLARTGELQLSDAQVVRLAAIARRSEARRVSMRSTMDSLRRRFTPDTRPDSATRRQIIDRLRADAERMREQEHADRRDAIAVLTAEQQARAWEMVASRGHGGHMRRGMRKGMHPGMGRGLRDGRPMGHRRDFRPDREMGGRGEMRPRMRGAPPIDD